MATAAATTTGPRDTDTTILVSKTIRDRHHPHHHCKHCGHPYNPAKEGYKGHCGLDCYGDAKPWAFRTYHD